MARPNAAEVPIPAESRRGRPLVVPEERRRAQLIDTGRELFLLNGYARTTMDMVAARAHVSKQTLYRWFPSKVALFQAVVAAHRHTMLALPGDYDHLPIDLALEAIFRVELDERQDRERMALIFMAIGESTIHPELNDAIVVHGAARSAADLALWLAREVERGRVIALDDPLAHARILMDMVFGIHDRSGSGRNVVGTQERRSHIRRCIGIFTRGVAVR